MAAADLDGEPVWGDLVSSEGSHQVHEGVVAATDRLDVLVHNAGVLLRGSLADVSRADLETCFAINTLAPIGLTAMLRPELRRSGAARVVVVSSTMGQFASGMSGGSLPYRISKAAVNVFVANCAAELRADGILLNAMHPGWVKTDMGGSSATVAPETAAETALLLAALPPDGPSGRFWRDGREIDW